MSPYRIGICAVFDLIDYAYSHFLHKSINWRHVLGWIIFYLRHARDIDYTQLDNLMDDFGFGSFYDSFWRLGQYLLAVVPEDTLSASVLTG